MYRAIRRFRDLITGDLYEAGEKYPRHGKAAQERLEELSSNKNASGMPLIEEVPRKRGK